MPANFDIAAQYYDSDFTNTKIGQLQRQRVWKYLDKIILDNNISSVLELNCGTGADAIYLDNKGCQVVATDLSDNMLTIAKQKSANQNITYKKLDLSNPQLHLDQEFDLVFSNFGGLNCITENQLVDLQNWIKTVTHEDSHLIFILMPSMTIVDRLYRKIKGEHDINNQRKNAKTLPVHVNGQTVQTYYHDPEVIRNIFSMVSHVNTHSIGFIPSFLEKNKLRDVLLMFDRLLYTIGMDPIKSDHYLIHLIKKHI